MDLNRSADALIPYVIFDFREKVEKRLMWQIRHRPRREPRKLLETALHQEAQQLRLRAKECERQGDSDLAKSLQLVVSEWLPRIRNDVRSRCLDPSPARIADAWPKTD